MTPDEARKVAIAIADTWPQARIAIERWAEPLQRLDIDQARNTYRHLRDNEDRAPTIAQFLAKNRELHATTTSHHREPCALCDSTGWQSVTVHREGHPYPTSGVIPCRCTNGQQMRDSHRRAIEANDANRTDTSAIYHGTGDAA